MSDNITLPRAVLWRVVCEFAEGRQGQELTDAISAIAAALAEPKETFAESLFRRSWEAHRAALAEPDAICSAKDNEAALERVANRVKPGQVKGLLPEPDAKQEPATEKQVAEVFKLSGAVYWGHYRDGWREAERFHGIRMEDK
jgi:hypothetical protein